jgi:hypothetical protein
MVLQIGVWGRGGTSHCEKKKNASTLQNVTQGLGRGWGLLLAHVNTVMNLRVP